MPTPEQFWLRRPVFEAMEYTSTDDLDDMRAWAAAQNTDASEYKLTRIEPIDGGGFQLYLAWVWEPENEFLGQSGQPGDWLMNYNSAFQVFTAEQMATEYEPVIEDTPPEGGGA